jgi:replicative DNA helicase
MTRYELERSILSSLLLYPEAIEDVLRELGDCDFAEGENRLVFCAMAELHEQGDPIDLLFLSEQLNETGRLQDAGGLIYLAELADFASTGENLIAHSRRLRSVRLVPTAPVDPS